MIFVDGFPYEQLGKTPFLASMATVSPLTPGFGYSVNLHMELFAGKTPDQVGYFGEWAMRSAGAPRSRVEALIPLLGGVSKVSRFADKLLHFGLRKVFRWDTAYIPFEILGLFEKRGRYPMIQASHVQTIFDRYPFDMAISDTVRAATGKKDAPTLAKAMDVIDRGAPQVFVSLCDLDGISHEHGVNSAPYDQRLAVLDDEIKRLHDRFLERHPDGLVVVLSDHGMANAHQAVDLGLEKRFGPPRANGLVYFYDSLYLAVLSPDEAQLAEIRAYLADRPEGRLLSDAERAQYGLTSPSFGQLIFLLHEGFAFNPNYFGYHMLKGYHGYHPDCPSQKGIFLCSARVASPPRRNLEVHGFVTSLMDGVGSPA